MGKLQEFLMDAEIGTTQTEVQIAPFPFPFVIRSITEAENKAIRKTCQKVEFDKKTRQKRIDTDTDLYNARLVAACCIDPNFKDADFQAKKGVRGAEDLINLVLNPGQYTDLLLAVQEINGFTDDVNELRDEAKTNHGGGNEADADGESVYAHYALHRLKILPGQLLALPRRERSFIYASIDLQIEKEKKEVAKAKRRKGKKGR